MRHYLARLHPKTLCYSKSVEMLKHSIGLLVDYLKLAGGAGATEANTCLSLIHPVIQ
ncbi:MAG: IS1 family transposase [Moorea sp. SIOASIH]|nr:IS1 family transposase [Moorena sp. SIOASIH]